MKKASRSNRYRSLGVHGTRAPSSERWVEFAMLAPGRSHHWFFDLRWDAYGSVFHATAHPEPGAQGQPQFQSARRVEVTELYVIQSRDNPSEQQRAGELNVTVTNTGDQWAGYTLWVATIMPRTARVKGS